MNRRRYLQSIAATGTTASAAGCLGVLTESAAEGTVLGPPEQDLSEAAHPSYGDAAAFLARTFDPERDTADVLREYARQQGVNLDAGNWHFLRPESYEAGQELLEKQFGLVIEKRPAEDLENLGYQFPHYGLIPLVNERGIVERAYPNGASVDIETVENDFEQVVTG